MRGVNTSFLIFSSIVRAAPHPVLTGQFGLFATAAIARDERCFVEKLPRLSELPASLEDSDRYISWIHKADREEFIIADDDDGTSMTYFLNSSYARDGEVNPLDKRGRDEHGTLDDAVPGSPEKDSIMVKKGASAPGEGLSLSSSARAAAPRPLADARR